MKLFIYFYKNIYFHRMNDKILNLNNFIDEKTFRWIYINKFDNILEIGFRTSQNQDFEKIYLSLNEYIDYTINIKHNHILQINNETFDFGNETNFYNIKNLINKYDYWMLSISGSNPIQKVTQIINENNINNYTIAEISGQYGSTAQYNLDNTKIKHYDIFEYKPELCNLLRKRFSKYNNVNVIEGDALETLNHINTKYDVIFYDCSHNYDIDIEIVKKMLKNLHKKSIVIFHDYDMDDVRKMIFEFCNMVNCKIYALEQDKIHKLQ